MTRTVTALEARQRITDILGEVSDRQTRVLVEDGGIPIAAIVSAADLRRLDRLDRARADRFAGLSRISEAFADVPLDELERQVERAIAQGRSTARRTGVSSESER